MSEQASGGYFGNIRQKLEQYIDARLRLIQLDTIEKVSNLVGLAAFFAIASSVLSLVLFSFSLMAGYYFAEIFGSYFKGFALVGGFYFIIFILLFFLRKSITNYISDQFVKTMFKNNQTSSNSDHEKS